jgi:hypothetical protein
MNASEQITRHIHDLGGWRGKLLEQLRALIREAAPDAAEDWKWNTPVWSQNGNLLAIGAFQDHVKINCFKGASLEDSAGLFNAGLEAKASRAIDLREGDPVRTAALRELIRAAAALNGGKPKSKPGTGPKKR